MGMFPFGLVRVDPLYRVVTPPLCILQLLPNRTQIQPFGHRPNRRRDVINLTLGVMTVLLSSLNQVI